MSMFVSTPKKWIISKGFLTPVIVIKSSVGCNLMGFLSSSMSRMIISPVYLNFRQESGKSATSGDMSAFWSLKRLKKSVVLVLNGSVWIRLVVWGCGGMCGGR